MARLSRRQLLSGLSGLAAASVLAACQQAPAPTPTTPPAAKPTTAPAAAAPTPAATAAPKPAAATTAPPAATATPAQQAAAKPTAAAPAKPVGTPKRGGELRILQINDFVSMDPIFASGPTARACYDSLFAWRPNDKGVFTVQPMLAKSWETSSNKIVLKLQENVKFHDGSPLDADAVVWNIKRMVQNPKSFAATKLPAIDKKDPAVSLDPLTVQINLTRPSAAVLSVLSEADGNTPIVSKKAAEDHGEQWLHLNPVGTGPFKFVSFAAGDKLVVKRNENYWQKGLDGKPLPYADGATYRVIIEATTQFNEMRAGTADLIQNIRGRDVPAAKQIAHARYLDSPFNGTKRQMFFNALKPPFKDNLNLRLAVQHAIDREAMAKALGAGLGMPLPWEFCPGQVGYDTSVPYYTFDLDKARNYMKQAGVQTPLPVRMVVHSREVDQAQAQLIQAMLDKIGIKINIDLVERVAWGEKVRINNDFEAATRQTNVDVDPVSQLLVTWAEGGNSAYHRAHVPGLIDTLNQADAEYDDKKRQELFVKAQTLMHESAWFVYLWFEIGNNVVHKRIQNFPSAVWGSLREAEWWIDESAV